MRKIINKTTGDLLTEGGILRLYSGMQVTDINGSGDNVEEAPMGFILRKQAIGSVLFNIKLVFAEGILKILHLSIWEEANRKDWSSWSEAAEIEKKKQYDGWLEESLGNPPYIYKWGSVEAIYDKRAGESVIIITYK